MQAAILQKFSEVTRSLNGKLRHEQPSSFSNESEFQPPTERNYFTCSKWEKLF